MYTQDTICAVATAQGGAIGIIRVSGPEAITVADRIFSPASQDGLPLSGRKPYTLTFGTIRDAGGEVVDEVLVSLFRAPHSYTGEDSVEISCHGSSYILQQVMQLLIRNGCRAAGPGEFTQRAFLNGKMDLSQAEAVADLIASSSAATHRLAMNQMKGGFSKELAALREKLLHLTSLMELELDFSDHEELEFADRSELKAIAAQIEQVIGGLVRSFSTGNAIKNGIPVAIIGETNAGKSTLLNALLNEERAIVSDIHGTTRDVIEDTMNIGGVTFRFIDTAGIRETSDTIESLGIERSFQKLEQADIVLWVIDRSAPHPDFARLSGQILPRCAGKHLIVVWNKADLSGTDAAASLKEVLPQAEMISISAKRIAEGSASAGRDDIHFRQGPYRHPRATGHASPGGRYSGDHPKQCHASPGSRYSGNHPKQCHRDQCPSLRGAQQGVRGHSPCTGGYGHGPVWRPGEPGPA